MLMDIEQNIANIERNLATVPQGGPSALDRRMKTLKRATTVVGTGVVQAGQDKRRTTLKSMRSLIRLVKKHKVFQIQVVIKLKTRLLVVDIE